MSEYASRERGSAGATASGAHVVPPKQQAPAEVASARAAGFAHEVTAIGEAVDAVRHATDANDLPRWHEARQTLDRRLAAAHTARDRMQEHARVATPEVRHQIAATGTALAEHERAAGALSEPPLGWRALSREAEILAIARAPIEDRAREGWARKMAALESELVKLSVAESRALVSRLEKQQPSDPIARELSPGVRITHARFRTLLGFLAGAPRRAATRPARGEGAVSDEPQPLPLRDAFERATGAALGHVRIHPGRRGREIATAHDARAVAIGSDIYLAEGPLDPARTESRSLLAHEVAHVVQASGDGADTASTEAAEEEADAFAAEFVESGGATPWRPSVAVASGEVLRAPAAHEVSRAKRGGLPAGTDFQHVGGLALRVRRRWLESDPAWRKHATRSLAPARAATLLDALRTSGVIGWASPEAITRAARTIAITTAGHTETVVVQWDAQLYNVIGLPPGASFAVTVRGSSAVVTVSAAGASAPSGQEIVLDGPQLHAFVAALTEGLGLTPLPDTSALLDKLGAARTVKAYGGTGVFTLTAERDTLVAIFGDEQIAWWEADRRSRRAGTPGTATAAGTAPTQHADLTEKETAELSRWLATHLGQGGEGFQLLDRSMLVQIRAIEADPHRSLILDAIARLQAQNGAARVTSPGELDALIQHAKVEAFSVEKAPFEPGRPIDEMPVPARIEQHAGLVISGEDVPLSIAIDWPPEFANEGERLVRRFKPRVADIEWIFSKQVETPPPDLVRHQRYVGAPEALKHRFVLAPHEEEAIWSVTALVRHSHFLPAYLSTQIQVRSERRRMADLRAEAGFGEMGQATSSDHDFQTSLYNEALGDDAYDHGKRLEGTLPKAFGARTAEQRRAQRAAERRRMTDMVAYLRERPGSADAREAAQWHVRRLEEADREIDGDEKAGLKSFEVRGAFLSRQPGVADGPLDLYGTVSAPKRRERTFRGRGESEVIVDEVVRVQLRDLSRRFESETYVFWGEAPTFAAALEAAFVKLTKAYPSGRMSLLAQAGDKTIGFELDTGTAWKDHKAKVFAPVVNTVISLASIAAMVFFPAAAPMAMGLLTAFNGVQSFDAMAEASRKGTLTGSKIAVNLGSIALDLLPLIGRASSLGKTRLGWYALEGLDHGGQVALMTASARDAIHAQKELLVVGLAEQYQQLVELEKTTHPSDPRLAAARAAIDRKAKEVSQVTYQVIDGLVGDESLVFTASRAFHAAGHALMTREMTKLADTGGFENVAGAVPHYDRTRGVVIADPTKLDLPTLRSLEAARHAHLREEAAQLAYERGIKPEHVEVVLGDDIRIDAAPGRITLTYRTGLAFEQARERWHAGMTDARLAMYRKPVAVSRTAPALTASLGERIARASGTHYANHGVFEVETAAGRIAVEIRRTGASRVRVVAVDEGKVIVEVPKGMSPRAFEREVEAQLAKVRQHARQDAVGEHVSIHPDLHGPPTLETRAAMVPGSSFHGRGAKGVRGTEVLAEAREALASVLHLHGDVLSIEPVDASKIVKKRDRPRAEQTFVVTLKPVGKAPPERFTIRLAVGPLEGETVARSILNPTQRGLSPTETAVHHIQGRYVIQLSNELDAAHVKRALAHEVAEIRQVRALAAQRRYPGQDALRPGASGSKLSPHDLGRLAEIEVLVEQLADPGTQVHARQELAALVEHLGLRDGTDGASARFELAAPHLSKRVLHELTEARRPTTDLTPEARAELAAIGERAKTHLDAERTRQAARAVAHDMPSSLDEQGRPLGADELRKRAEHAAEVRAARSDATWQELAALHALATSKGDTTPLLPYVAQIGGGASLAGRDRGHLVIDDRGRWHEDGSTHIAQTGAQLKQTKDAGLGDPTKLVAPDERLPLDAVRYWEDNIAAQGPVINGRASMRLGDDGTMLLDIRYQGKTLTFRTERVPIVATGFVPERLPGAPFGMGPAMMAGQVEKQLLAFAKAALSGEVKSAVEQALATLKKTPMSTHEHAIQLVAILGSPTLRKAFDKDPVIQEALKLGNAAAHWKALRVADDPANPHLLSGDQANIGREHALRSNNFAIGGTGGTGVSAAEIILDNNPKAHVTMIGDDEPSGLMENDQFFKLAQRHGDEGVARRLQIPKGDGRLSIVGDYLGAPTARARDDGKTKAGWVDESNIPAEQRSRSIYDVGGTKTHTEASTYIVALGRNDDYPPIVADLIDQARREGWNYQLTPNFHDRQYVGYTVTIDLGAGKTRSVDVTAAASRFIPNDKTHMTGEARADFAKIEAASDWDAPPESGNFAGGFAATATQAARFAAWRRRDGTASTHDRKERQ